MINSTLSLNATPDSLPYCLRHSGTDTALHEARCLTSLLQDITFLQILTEDENLNTMARRGLEQVLFLLQDKLDIAAGVYKFPMVSRSDDAVVLAERIVEEAE